MIDRTVERGGTVVVPAFAVGRAQTLLYYRYVKIHGEWVPIHAEVANLRMLSAHADADELLRWASGFETPPRHTFVVHGEPQAADTLRTRLDRELGLPATVPRQNQVFEL